MPPVGFEPKISAGERPQAARLLRSWVRIPPGAWIFVCCECRVLSGRGLCDELITRPEESYRLCCVVVCDLETSRMGAPYIYDISRLRVKTFICVYLWRFLIYNATSSLLISKLLAYSCIEQDRPCSYKRNNEARSRDHCCHGKKIK